MARFRYKMQNILSIKEKMETQAKQHFGEAKRNLDLEQDALDALFRRKEEIERHAVEVLQGDLDMHEIEDSQMSRIICDQRISEQKLKVSRAEAALERARAELEEAVKAGIEMPPIIVHYVDGEFELNDGNHRLQVYRDLGIEKAWTIIWITEELELKDFVSKYGEYVKDCTVVRR